MLSEVSKENVTISVEGLSGNEQFDENNRTITFSNFTESRNVSV
jgi:hypothetical protein